MLPAVDLAVQLLCTDGSLDEGQGDCLCIALQAPSELDSGIPQTSAEAEEELKDSGMPPAKIAKVSSGSCSSAGC